MKQGDLMFVKTTEEPVVVVHCNVVDNPAFEVSVRRPVQSRDGIQYVHEVFGRFELETPTEKDLRLIDDLKRRHKLTQEASKDVEQIEMFDSPDIPKKEFRN